MFCPNCGNQFENENNVCPNCGIQANQEAAPAEVAPAADAYVPAEEAAAPAKKLDNKLIGIIGIGVAVVAVIIALILLLGGGAKGTVKKYVKSQANYDYKAENKCYTVQIDYKALYEAAETLDDEDFEGDEYKEFRQAIKEAGSNELKKVWPEYQKVLKKEAEAKMRNLDIRTVVDVDTSDEWFEQELEDYNSRIKSLQETYKKYDFLKDCEELSKSDIKAAKKVYYVYDIKADKEEDCATNSSYELVVKIGGSWKILGCDTSILSYASFGD